MTDDPELAEFEERRSANRKTLAIIGLVAVSALLLWKCGMQADRVGLGVGGGPSKAEPQPLEISIARGGKITTRDCAGDLDYCVARAKVRARDGATDRVSIVVEPGAPPAIVAQMRELVQSFELVPVLD